MEDKGKIPDFKGYIFKSHDWRYTLATFFYENGTSLQNVREYLGHEYEEMTDQYVDYVPTRIDKENEKFFEIDVILHFVN